VAVSIDDRDEPEYANPFTFRVGFSEEELGSAHRGRIQLNACPVFNRWAEDRRR
jgi:hypothetical protein